MTFLTATLGLAAGCGASPPASVPRRSDAAAPAPASSAEAFLQQGDGYFDRDDYDGAIEAYSQAIALKPDFAEAYNNRGYAYFRRGDRLNGSPADKDDLTRAIADYDRAVALRPDYGYAYNNRGIAEYDLGEYDRAIADHSQALQLDPNNDSALVHRGNAYSAKGDLALALADWNRATVLRLARNVSGQPQH